MKRKVTERCKNVAAAIAICAAFIATQALSKQRAGCYGDVVTR